MFRKMFVVLLALFLVSAACNLSIALPERPTPGPTVTDEISVVAPDSKNVQLEIEFGAGELNLQSGAENKLVTGSATYNVPELKPSVVTEDRTVSISQSGTINSWPVSNVKNKWDLSLGNTPMDLSIAAGAYQGRFDLGGLMLTSLTVKDGAADVKLDFSQPNQTVMEVLRYETGASNVNLTHIGNANANSIIFKSGAGNYTLDFSGGLQRDLTVNLESGVSNVTLLIPEGVAARLMVDAGLTNVNMPNGWEHDGNNYTQSGKGPTLTVVVKMGAGNLQVSR